MKYENIRSGFFIERPNRFLAHVEVDGKTVVCHVKNTGRCWELLIPGARVWVQYHPGALEMGRKTEYSLIAVEKDIFFINMDSQAPNQVAAQWLKEGGFSKDLGASVSDIRREVTFGTSRFDLAFQADGKPCFMEVKGVTLEEDGVAMFPDAPTERGVKHLQELGKCGRTGIWSLCTVCDPDERGAGVYAQSKDPSGICRGSVRGESKGRANPGI